VLRGLPWPRSVELESESDMMNIKWYGGHAFGDKMEMT
jgi:hypothetical protein